MTRHIGSSQFVSRFLQPDRVVHRQNLSVIIYEKEKKTAPLGRRDLLGDRSTHLADDFGWNANPKFRQ